MLKIYIAVFISKDFNKFIRYRSPQECFSRTCEIGASTRG